MSVRTRCACCNDTLSDILEPFCHSPWSSAVAVADRCGGPGRHLASGPVNLAGALLRTAATAPDRPAVVGPEPATHGQLAARVAAAAAELASRGLAPGDRVALLAGNELGFVVGALAVVSAGGVVVPLNVTSPAREVARELGAVEPALLMSSPSFEDLGRRAVAQLATDVGTLVVAAAGEPRDTPAAAAPTIVDRQPSDVAALLFTAGTGGPPKPAMLTHGSLLSNLEQIQAHPGLRLTPDDVCLGLLPFFHVFGLNVVLHLSLLAGGAVAIVDHFHPAETLARVRADRVTVVGAVPAVYAGWLALDERTAPADAFAGVRLCVSGAAPLERDLVVALRDRFGVVVHDGYGLTEASPVVTTTAVVSEPRPNSIGPPLPGVDVRLVDADGNDVLAGDPGEILVRGPNVFAGYWGDDDATARVLDAQGWLHTGDLAVADDDGWLSLIDRAKDVVIVSGFNVYPGEVEDVLAAHPAVAEVAVVGEPHPRTGEAVVAYVVARDGATIDPVELVRFGGRRLARYKLPTRVEVVDALPRTFVGKLLRRALSESDAGPDSVSDSDAGDVRATRPPDATTNPE